MGYTDGTIKQIGSTAGLPGGDLKSHVGFFENKDKDPNLKKYQGVVKLRKNPANQFGVIRDLAFNIFWEKTHIFET